MQDRLIFVMYMAGNSYNKTLTTVAITTTSKKKKKTLPMCLHEILSNRDAQTDFRTVQDSEFLG
jgi:hypothetical protein